MKIFVTGANGFLGSAVVRHLINAGYPVRAFVRRSSNLKLLDGFDIEIARGDVRDFEAVNKAMDGCGVVFHLASVYEFYPWWQRRAKSIYETNLEGAKNVLKAALRHNIERCVFTSSIVSIGKSPDGQLSDETTEFNFWQNSSHYARSKVLAEQEVFKAIARGLAAVILNPAILIGQRDYKPTPSGEMIVKFLNESYPFYFKALMAFADVDDVARTHVAAIEKGRVGQRYILCGKKAYSLKEFFELLEEITGVPAPRKKIPYPMLLSFLYVDEVLSYFVFKKKPLMPSEGTKFCRMSLKFDNSKAVRELGYKQTPFKETLTKAVNWYKENGYVKNA